MNHQNINKLILTVLITLPAMAYQAFAQDKQTTELIDRLGFRETSMASRDMPGWSRPSKISIASYGEIPDSGIGSQAWIDEISDGVEIKFLPGTDEGEYRAAIADSEVYVGGCSATALSAGKNLDYIHILSAGMDRCMSIPGVRESAQIWTNSAKAASETIAEHSIALMLALTRNLHFYHTFQRNSDWKRSDPTMPPAITLKGRTMLVLGLGGIGSQVAQRAHALGMRVIGTRNSSRSGPDYVDYVGLSDEMQTLAQQADVVVNALPLTDATVGIVNSALFSQIKDNGYYVSVGRGATTDTEAMITALKSGKLAGAGLDVTDPEPLPSDHELWLLPNVIISPHRAAASNLSRMNTWILARENLRRYIRGEPLLNRVDIKRGY